MIMNTKLLIANNSNCVAVLGIVCILLCSFVVKICFLPSQSDRKTISMTIF